MAALNKVIKVGDFYARVANRCKQVENFEHDENSLCVIIGMEIIANFTAAHSSMRRDFFMHEELPVVGTASAAHIDISTKSYFDVTNVSHGMTRQYHHAKSMTDFLNKQASEAHEQKVDGRYWYAEPGTDKILLFRGTDALAKAEASLSVFAVRYPDISIFTMDNVRANTLFVDLPLWAIPFTVSASAISAVKEQNLGVPQSMQNEMTGIMASLGDKMAAEELKLAEMRLTNPSK